MEHDYDVVVVGAGVGGLNAARYATADGSVRAAVIDPHPRGDGRTNSTEGCGERMFRDFDVPADGPYVSERIHRGQLWFENGRDIEVVLKHKRGAVLEVRELRRWLAEQCRNTDFISARFADFNSDTHTLHLTTGETVTAGAVIGADGVNSRVAQAAGFDDPLPESEYAVAGQWLVEHSDLPRNKVEVYLSGGGSPVKTPGGYAWMFSKGEGAAGNRAWVGLGVEGDRLNGEGVRAMVERFMEWRVPGARRIRWDGGVIPVTRPRPGVVRGNVMLVGDAARVCRAGTGAGLTTAMHSGMLAGESILAGNPPESYEEALKRATYPALERSYRLKRRLLNGGGGWVYRGLRLAAALHRASPWLVEKCLTW